MDSAPAGMVVLAVEDVIASVCALYIPRIQFTDTCQAPGASQESWACGSESGS